MLNTIKTLTKRQLEVVTLLACDYSIVEISKNLAIAPNTVERHLEGAKEAILGKDRCSLVIYFYQNVAIFAGVMDSLKTRTKT